MFLIASASGTITNKQYYLAIEDLQQIESGSSLKLATPQRDCMLHCKMSTDSVGVKSFISPSSSCMLILTNDNDSSNYRLLSAPLTDLSQSVEILPHRPEVYIDHMSVYTDYLVLWVLSERLQKIEIYDIHPGTCLSRLPAPRVISFSEESSVNFLVITYPPGIIFRTPMREVACKTLMQWNLQ